METARAVDVTVISKAARILDAFTAQRPKISLGELSSITGLTPSTALRRADDLLRAGLLTRDTTGRYAIGSALQRIAMCAPTGVNLIEVAQPVMQELFLRTRYDVGLVVREGVAGLVVARMFGSAGLPMMYTVGSSIPLHATGSGLALLANSSGSDQQEILDGPLPALTPYTCTDPDALRTLLARVRERGYVQSDRGADPSAAAIGAPILDSGGHAIAGLSVVFRHGDGPLRALTETTRAASRAISRALGAPERRADLPVADCRF